MDQQTEERRARPRIQIEVEVSLTSESQFYSGLSGDISEGGLFVATYSARPVGSRVDLSLSLPSGEIQASGTVRWIRDARGDAPPGVGIEFEDLSAETQETIAAFMTERAPLYHDVDEPAA